jgi:hypothetical protein
VNTFHALKYLYLDRNKFGRCLKKSYLSGRCYIPAEVEVTHFYGIYTMYLFVSSPCNLSILHVLLLVASCIFFMFQVACPQYGQVGKLKIIPRFHNYHTYILLEGGGDIVCGNWYHAICKDKLSCQQVLCTILNGTFMRGASTLVKHMGF